MSTLEQLQKHTFPILVDMECVGIEAFVDPNGIKRCKSTLFMGISGTLPIPPPRKEGLIKAY